MLFLRLETFPGNPPSHGEGPAVAHPLISLIINKFICEDGELFLDLSQVDFKLSRVLLYAQVTGKGCVLCPSLQM